MVCEFYLNRNVFLKLPWDRKLDFPSGTRSKKNLAADAGDTRYRFNPWVGKIPWRRKCHPTPIFLPGKSYGQRILVGYSPYCCKELPMTEHSTRGRKLVSIGDAIS